MKRIEDMSDKEKLEAALREYVGHGSENDTSGHSTGHSADFRMYTQQFTEEGFKIVVSELSERRYLGAAPLPGNIITLTPDDMHSPHQATMLLYDDENIQVGMDNGDIFAFIAQAACDLAKAMDDTFGLRTDWAHDSTIFDQLMKTAMTQWNAQCFEGGSRIHSFLSSNEYNPKGVQDYALNIAMNGWLQKMEQVHGIQRTWE